MATARVLVGVVAILFGALVLHSLAGGGSARLRAERTRRQAARDQVTAGLRAAAEEVRRRLAAPEDPFYLAARAAIPVTGVWAEDLGPPELPVSLRLVEVERLVAGDPALRLRFLLEAELGGTDRVLAREVASLELNRVRLAMPASECGLVAIDPLRLLTRPDEVQPAPTSGSPGAESLAGARLALAADRAQEAAWARLAGDVADVERSLAEWWRALGDQARGEAPRLPAAVDEVVFAAPRHEGAQVEERLARLGEPGITARSGVARVDLGALVADGASLRRFGARFGEMAAREQAAADEWRRAVIRAFDPERWRRAEADLAVPGLTATLLAELGGALAARRAARREVQAAVDSGVVAATRVAAALEPGPAFPLSMVAAWEAAALGSGLRGEDLARWLEAAGGDGVYRLGDEAITLEAIRYRGRRVLVSGAGGAAIRELAPAVRGEDRLVLVLLGPSRIAGEVDADVVGLGPVELAPGARVVGALVLLDPGRGDRLAGSVEGAPASRLEDAFSGLGLVASDEASSAGSP